MSMNQKIAASGIAAAALFLGATGAVAATAAAAATDCCGGLGQGAAPYYLESDVDVRPDGTTVEGDVQIGVHESESGNRVVGTEQSVARTGAETNPSDVKPQIVLDPDGGAEITTVNVPGEIICVQPSVCTPGVQREVRSGDIGARMFDSSGEDAVTVHHTTGSTSVDPGEACVRTTGCSDTGGGRVASVANPDVTINE